MIDLKKCFIQSLYSSNSFDFHNNQIDCFDTFDVNCFFTSSDYQ
ncbi:MAG: hypothetical protein PHX04_00335 [Bacilli bacterium]|nr:hypothetical protein [Bacilli bacterium]